jgi:hypothetical protein
MLVLLILMGIFILLVQVIRGLLVVLQQVVTLMLPVALQILILLGLGQAQELVMGTQMEVMVVLLLRLVLPI